MTQRGAASPRVAATIFGIGHHRMRQWIRDGLVVPHAVGRRSLVLFSDIEAVLRKMPPTRSSKSTTENPHATH
jgi:hypothetical protein